MNYRNTLTLAVVVVFSAIFAYRRDAPWFFVGALVTIVLAIVTILAMNGRSARRHKAVVAGHPGAQVLEVWAVDGLRETLEAHGADGRVPFKVTALSMVIGPQRLELWHGSGRPTLLFALPWSELVGAIPGAGAVDGNGPRPGLTLVTSAGGSLTVCPTVKPTGSSATISGAPLQGVIDMLNARVGGDPTDNRTG